MRKEGYAILLEKAKEVIPGCDERFVKSKIESLRASFRREFKKVNASKTRTGSGQDEVYEPTLWYYDLMSFTIDQEEVRKGVSSLAPCSRLGDNTSEAEIENEEREDIDSPINIAEPDDSTELRDQRQTSASSSRRASSTPSPAPIASKLRPKRKKTCALEKKQEDFLEVATTVLANNNKYKAFGSNVAFQLEDMERQQQVIAEKLISDVLFHGKMGNLKVSSTFALDQPPQQNWQPANQESNYNAHYSQNLHTSSFFPRQSFYPQLPQETFTNTIIPDPVTMASRLSTQTNIERSPGTSNTTQRGEVYQVLSAQKDVRAELGPFMNLD